MIKSNFDKLIKQYTKISKVTMLCHRHPHLVVLCKHVISRQHTPHINFGQMAAQYLVINYVNSEYQMFSTNGKKKLPDHLLKEDLKT